jgi:hypothetical protein
MRPNLALWSLALAALTLGYGDPIHAQSVIAGFAGFGWGTTRSEILRRLGTPVEDLREGDRERISYKQGSDSGYMFAFRPDHGLVAGIRILPLALGPQCVAAVRGRKAAIAREYPRLVPLETRTSGTTGLCGVKDWSVLWLDRGGNRILLTIDATKHRLYIYYSNPFGS